MNTKSLMIVMPVKQISSDSRYCILSTDYWVSQWPLWVIHESHNVTTVLGIVLGIIMMFGNSSILRVAHCWNICAYSGPVIEDEGCIPNLLKTFCFPLLLLSNFSCPTNLKLGTIFMSFSLSWWWNKHNKHDTVSCLPYSHIH